MRKKSLTTHILKMHKVVSCGAFDTMVPTLIFFTDIGHYFTDRGIAYVLR